MGWMAMRYRLAPGAASLNLFMSGISLHYAKVNAPSQLPNLILMTENMSQ